MMMPRRVYFDYAAATPLAPSVARIMQKFERTYPANPNSIHQEGAAARREVEAARERVAELCGAHRDEVIFTKNATEANFLALKGAVTEFRRTHPDVVPQVLVSAVEHASVFEAAEELAATQGVLVREIPVDRDGTVSEKDLHSMLSLSVAAVSVMYVNNEFGTIQPLRRVARMVKEFRTQAGGRFPFIHTDACQALALLDINVARLHVDMMSLSPAKVFGPKGVGILFLRRGISRAVVPAGTEWGAGIVGAAAACTRARAHAATHHRKLTGLHQEFMKVFSNEIPEAIVNGRRDDGVPSIINFSIPGISSDYLSLALDAEGFAVSAGSACAAGSASESRAILALGKEGIVSGVRVSLSATTSPRDVRRFVKKLKKILVVMRPYRFISDI
ncbi:MAG: cysteine desulfurase family protein [Minisyncoccota bacterium]